MKPTNSWDWQATTRNAPNFIRLRHAVAGADVDSSGNFRIKRNDGENLIPLVLHQADTTNNPDALRIIQEGTGDAISVRASASGSDVFTVDNGGSITGADITLTTDDATNNGVTDLITIKHTTSGTAAAGIGAGIAFQVEDAGGVEEQGSIDVVLTDVTDGAEDADLVVRLNKNGTMTEVFRIDGDADTIDLVAQTIQDAGSGETDLTTGLGANVRYGIKIKVAGTDYYIPAYTTF